MLSDKEIKERLKKGYLKVYMAFEVVGTAKDVVEKALKEHVEKFAKDERVEIISQKDYDAEEIEAQGRKLFSKFSEVEFLTRTFENLVNLVLFYGPSACEILAPERIEIELGEAQNILNTLGSLMHRLSERVGGIVVKKE